MTKLNWELIDPEPQNEEVFYRDIWVQRDGPQNPRRFWPGSSERKRYTWLRTMIEQHAPSRRVLDAGCNIGEILRLLIEDKIITAEDAYGLDIDPMYITLARIWVEGATFDCRALEYVAESELGNLGAVIACEVLEHVLDPARALAALAGVLSPDGILLITTPDDTHWSRNYARVYPGKHRHIFDEAILAKLFQKSHLSVIDVTRLGPRDDGLVYLMMAARK